MPIYRVQAPNGKIYKVEGPENADPNALFGFVQNQLEAEHLDEMRRGEYGPGLLGTLTGGVSRGAKRLGSTFGDVVPAMAASALGFDEYAKKKMEEAAQTEREIQATNRPLFESYKQISGPMDALKYGIETIGEQVPNIATSLIPGVGAGAAATRLGLQGAAKAATVGAGTFLGSYAQNAPEVFQNVYEATGKLEPGAAALFGAASAALDSVLPASLANKLTGPAKIGLVEKVLEKSGMDKGLLRSITAGALQGVPTEGLTEGAQEAISIAAEKFVADNSQVFGSKEWNRIMESAVRGAVAGGAFGGAGGGVERAQALAERKQRYDEVMADRTATLEQRRKAAEELAAAQQAVQDAERAALSEEAMRGEEEQTELAGLQQRTPLTAKEQKIAANLERQRQKKEAAELKEAQAKLKKYLSATQMELDLPEPQVEIAPVPVEGQPDLFAPAAQVAQVAQKQPVSAQPETTLAEEPKVRTAPTLDTITKIEDPKSFGKLFGIGPTARILRPDGPLAGKDITNPSDAAEVKSVLEAYASGKPAAGAAAKIEEYLKRPEFQGAENVAGPVEQPTGAGVPVVDQPSGVVPAGAAEGTEPSGVVSAGPVAGEPAGGEAQQPAAVSAADHPAVQFMRGLQERAAATEAGAVDLTEARTDRKVLDQETQSLMARLDDLVARGLASGEDAAEARRIVETSKSFMEAGYKLNKFLNQIEGKRRPQVAPQEVVTPEAPKEPGKRAKKDLAKAEAGAQQAAQEQAQFVQEVDQNTNDILTSRLREVTRAMGLDDSEVPAEDYRGTDAHNQLRLAQLMAQYRDSESMLRESLGTPQEAKNQQQLADIEKEIAASGPDALDFFNQLRQLPARQQTDVISFVNREALNNFAQEVQSKYATQAKEREALRNEGKPSPKLEGKELAQAKAKYAKNRLAKAAGIVQDAIKTPAAKKAFAQDFAKRGLAAINDVITSLPATVGESLRNEIAFLYGGALYAPAYEGPSFNTADAQLAQAGDLKGLVRSMIDQIKDPAIRQVLRKIQSLNLGAKIEVDPVEGGKAGSYDPATNTITLDPSNGLNAHTFIHELVHAAISNVLANPSHPLTKDFQKFFMQIRDRLGAAYGAQDLQEFAAELVGNPNFQAVLKDIKTPRSESLFRSIMRRIAEFFGFAPKSSAFNTGLNFIDNAIDITSGVEPTAAQKMFLTMGDFPAVADIGRAMPALTRQTAEAAKNMISNLQGYDLKRMAFGVMRLDNLRDIYSQRLPSIQKLLDALELRTGMQERRIKDANDKYKRFLKVQRKNPEAMKKLNDIAIDARLEEVDILNPNFQPTAAQRPAYDRLKSQFNALPKDVQDVYRTIRNDYDSAFKQYTKLLEDAANEASPSLAKRLAEQFQARKPVVGYIPFLRQGNFWVEYTDPATGNPAVSSFESLRERQQFIDTMLKGVDHRTYQNIEDVRFSGEKLPPTHFIMQVMNQLRSKGASQAQLDGVYQAYLATFPAESLMKQFMKSKNRMGMERDIVRGYGDLMVRYARKLSNSEYVPQIDRAMRQIQQEAVASDDPTLIAVAQNITDQSAFFHNPNFNTFVHTATALSYFEYIAGNISSALINITSLPMLVYPLLTGRFGWGNTAAAMTAAGKTAMNDWGKSARYKNLYETLMDHAQLEHTMSREVMEGRRQTTDDFVGLKSRILDGLSIPFVATEKYTRAVTGIAAYDLARQSGMNEEQAIRYALNTVKDVHTSGMAATGPKWMQTPLGRLFFTFKSFVWNSAYIMARAFHQAFKGEDPAIRKAAQRQLLATYGMATVFTGIKGMPFYGAVSVLAQMINSLFGDDEEPFDFDEFLRDIFGEFLFKGAFNYATNLELANRAGIATDLIFRDDPRGVADHGYVLSALQQAVGPIGSIAVNTGRAVELFKQGEVERAIETAAPSFVRNALKGARYLVEGATTIKGDPIMEDIGAYNSLMQMIGFSPADLSSQYERVQAAKGFEREVNQRRQNLLTKYDMAVRSGDFDLMSTVLEEIDSFNAARPAKRITKDTLDRSQRAREAAEKDMIAGVRFDKSLLPEIEEKFFADEED